MMDLLASSITYMENQLLRLKNYCQFTITSSTNRTIRYALTLIAIREIDSPNLPKWEHGYPNDFYSATQFRGMFSEDGDKTVPLRSAVGLVAVPFSTVSSEHQKLMTKSQQIVVRELTGKEPTRIFDREFSPIKVFFIQIFSPITVIVTDPQGRRIGFENGMGVNQIPDAFYSGPGEEQFMLIPDPADGAYDVDATGTGSGEYAILSSVISDTSEASTTVNGTTLPNAVIEYALSISTDATTTIVAEPKDT